MSATFGFSAQVRKPIWNSRAGGSGVSARGSNGARAPGFTACQARYSRYNAPAVLSAVNATGTASSNAVTPTLASSMCTMSAVATPTSDTTPARALADRPRDEVQHVRAGGEHHQQNGAGEQQQRTERDHGR